MSEDLYWRLHALSKLMESSGIIDEDRDKALKPYATILDAMNAVRSEAHLRAQPAELREEIDDEVCQIMAEHGPDGHVDGHEVLTDMVMRRVAAAEPAVKGEPTDIDDLLCRMSEAPTTQVGVAWKAEVQRAIAALRTAQPPSQPPREPWSDLVSDGGMDPRNARSPSQPPREPLTDEQIDAACKTVPAAVYELMHGHEITLPVFRNALREVARAVLAAQERP